MSNDQETGPEQQSPVVHNERMTALAGAAIFLLIVTELVITANMHALISAHIFVGIMLSGPLTVKLCSTGYRFFRYHTKSPAYVRQGPPHILLRILAPLVVCSTLLVLITGFTMTVVGPTHAKLLFKIHTTTVAVWIPLVAVHIYAHLRNVPRLIASDWNGQFGDRAAGRARRLGINISALFLGVMAAILMIPVSSPWYNRKIPHAVPTPLVTGIIIAVFAILIAIPLLRQHKKR